MSLSNWEQNGWLVAHETSEQEIANLLAIVRRDLEDSQRTELSADWRLNIAYNAALQAAQAALAASGYRAARSGSGHYRTIESLRHTIHLDADTVAKIDAFRKRRNLTEYDRAGATSPAEADEMRELAVDLQQRVIDWLRSNHPEQASAS